MLKTDAEKKRGFTDKTLALIEEIGQVNLQSFRFEKEKIVEALKKSYIFAECKFPSEIIFCTDWTDKRLLSAASSAFSAFTASSASSAFSAFRAFTAFSAFRASIDYDFDYWVDDFEFLQHRKDKNSQKADAIYRCFFDARKAGCGYVVEWEDTIYTAPAPEIRINDSNQFHSQTVPAISWPDGLQGYFLDGVFFGKDLWASITNKTLSAQEAIKIENQDQRSVAMRYLGGDKILKELKGEKFAEDEYGELWRLQSLKDGNGNEYVYFRDADPSKFNEMIYVRVAPTMKTPQEAMERCYKLSRWKLDYKPSVRT